MVAALCLPVLVGGLLAGQAAAAAEPKKPAVPELDLSQALVIERIVAIVDNEIVLLSEVEQVIDQYRQAQPPPPGADVARWEQERRREILDTLVAEKLLDQEIKKLRIEVTEPEVDRVIQGTMAANNLNEAQLKQALAQQGLTYEEYHEGLKKQLMKAKIIQLKVKSRVQISDQEVRTMMASQRTKASKRFKVRARHIVFLVRDPAEEAAAREKARKAMDRVMAGEDFAEVAKDVSEGPSAPAGGQLGIFGKGEMVPEFEEAAFSAEVGVPVGPVRSPFGWHIIRVDERVSMADDGQSELEDQVRQRIYEREVEGAFQRYIDELKQKAFIELRPDAFER